MHFQGNVIRKDKASSERTCVCLFLSHISAPLIAVNGAWDEWSPWSLCSSTCGRGFRSRTRTCTPPQFGGEPCVGPEKQTKFCNIAVCPGMKKKMVHSPSGARTCMLHPPRTRTCADSCFCLSVCLLGPWPTLVDGVWNEWSSWSLCSASCANGTMQRTRECNGPSYGGSECRGEWLETVHCFLGECPGDADT